MEKFADLLTLMGLIADKRAFEREVENGAQINARGAEARNERNVKIDALVAKIIGPDEGVADVEKVKDAVPTPAKPVELSFRKTSSASSGIVSRHLGDRDASDNFIFDLADVGAARINCTQTYASSYAKEMDFSVSLFVAGAQFSYPCADRAAAEALIERVRKAKLGEGR